MMLCKWNVASKLIIGCVWFVNLYYIIIVKLLKVPKLVDEISNIMVKLNRPFNWFLCIRIIQCAMIVAIVYSFFTLYLFYSTGTNANEIIGEAIFHLPLKISVSAHIGILLSFAVQIKMINESLCGNIFRNKSKKKVTIAMDRLASAHYTVCFLCKILEEAFGLSSLMSFYSLVLNMLLFVMSFVGVNEERRQSYVNMLFIDLGPMVLMGLVDGILRQWVSKIIFTSLNLDSKLR